MELPATSEGMPATYEINGRQFIVVPVAAGTGLFAARFGGPGRAGERGAGAASERPVPELAPGDPPEQQAFARQGRGGRGGAGGPPGQYIVLALKQ